MSTNSNKNESNIMSSRDKILEALLELLKEKPLSAISISELSKKADISRMSFYRNYDSVEDILKTHLEEILEEYWYEDVIENDSDVYFGEKQLTHFFSSFYQHHNFLSTLISCGLADIFFDYITKYMLLKWGDDSGEKEKLELVAFSGILFNICKSWMKEDYCTPIDDLVDVVETICKNGIRQAI